MYGQKYYIRYSDPEGNSYRTEIHELEYTGDATELETTDDPFTLEVPVATDVLVSLRGQAHTIRLLASLGFELTDLQSDNEKQFLVIHRRFTLKSIISWSLNETPVGGFVDANLNISVNGVNVLTQFTNGSGSIEVNKSDLVTIEAYSLLAWTNPQDGLNLAVSGQPTLRAVTNPANLLYTNIPATENITIAVNGTWSTTNYTALRSAVFYNPDGAAVTFTKTYDAVNQVTAEANADADAASFAIEGQAYADTYDIDLGGVMWRGFLMPDGIIQSFVNQIWAIEIDCVDGIGLLKDLAFVDSAGLFFSGLMSVKDIIFNCIRRLGIPDMNFATSVNIYYDGADVDQNSLEQVFLNTERYVKDVNGEPEPMNCEEVLKSVLDIFSAVLSQRDGKFIICKPNELYDTSTDVQFYEYAGDTGNSLGLTGISMSVSLGSQINGAYPHHANENQIIKTEKAYKSFRVNYKFGLLKSLSENENFTDWTSGVPDGFNTVGGVTISEYFSGGMLVSGTADIAKWVVNEPISIALGQIVKIDFTIGYATGVIDAKFVLKIGLYYFRASTGTWETTMQYNDAYFVSEDAPTKAFSYSLPPAPGAGNLEFRMYGGNIGTGALWKYLRVSPIQASTTQVFGEFHTLTQTYDYSFIPENKIVYNGDNFDDTDIYVGSIYKSNGDLTEEWFRKSKLVPDAPDAGKGILQIMADETLRMHQKQYLRFSGGIYGFFHYLSVVQISGLTGKFMPLGMSFSYAKNTGDMTLIQIFNDDIPTKPVPDTDPQLYFKGTNFTITDDYGTPIKPIIK